MKGIRILLAFACGVVAAADSTGIWAQGKPCESPGLPFKVCASEDATTTAAASTNSTVFTLVVGGLKHPRGLTFGPGGRLYVAQAGTGGGSSTGKITEVRNPWLASPEIHDLVDGLVSVGQENTAVSVAGLSAIGNGNIYAIMEESNIGTGFTSLLGHLLKVSQDGQILDVSNVGDSDYVWELAHINLNPKDFPDVNPYGVLALPGRLYVTDAAANTLNLVTPDGTNQILAYIPNNIIKDATPTCVAQGPDGALYIGTLALVDSLVFGPSAKVYRVDPSQTDPNNFDAVLHVATLWAKGLWPINGCAFGPDGSFYVSELITSQKFSGGDVVKIPFATPNVHTSLTNNSLTFPAGVAIGPDGNIYVSNGTAFVSEGQVVRLANH